MKIVGVISARGGSKRVSRKNLRLLDGKPLISYVLKTARSAKTLTKVIVSTEDEEIASFAKACGIEVPFIRPSELARDEVSLIPVMRHALEYYDNNGWRPDVVVSLQPTAPLTEPRDVDNAVNKLLESGCDSVVSVSRIFWPHPYRALILQEDEVKPLFPEAQKFLQRQELPVLYALNGAIFVRKRALLENWSGTDFALGKDVRAIVIDAERTVDINSQVDFLVAEAILKCKGETSNGYVE